MQIFATLTESWRYLSQIMAFLFLVLLPLGMTNAHMKFVYPEPRSDGVGIKEGPCGSEDFSTGTVTTLTAGSIVTVEIVEAIHHRGAPYRIALSHVLNDTYSDCILLNHIPQHTYNRNAKLFIDINN